MPKRLVSVYQRKVIKKGLGTDSPTAARRLAAPLIAAIKKDFDERLAKLDGNFRALISDLPALRRELNEAELNGEEVLARHIAYAIQEQRETIAPIRFKNGVQYNFEQEQKALSVFDDILAGNGTPLDLHLNEHIVSLRSEGLQRRTISDVKRAVAFLSQYLTEKKHRLVLESVDANLAEQFLQSLKASDGVSMSASTKKKYHGRLSLYWRWLRRRKIIDVNPWSDAQIIAPKTKSTDKERPFRNSEVAKLLNSTKDPSLRDPMLIAALTGARLDVIISLKVQHFSQEYGCIFFEPRKREPDGRWIPVHPKLLPIISSRISGKHEDDDLFPEWPGPASQESERERSFKYSNAFTDYRRSIGVDERREGNRRSRINFHSFRRWFSTRLEIAGVDENLISAIMGHKRKSIALNVYSAGPTAKSVRNAIESIKIPGVDGEAIIDDFLIAPGRS